MRWLKHRGAADKSIGTRPVYLVYGTATPGGDEPLIAVLDSEGKAANLESRITRDTLGSEVRWEEHHVAGPLDGDTAVAIVMHNPSPLGTGNPVASSVHSDVAAATDEAARQRRHGFDVEVLELRLGWELPDWPQPERVTPNR